MVIDIFVLIDTSVLVAYANEDDQQHKKSLKMMKDALASKYGRIIISDYIFDETATVCLRKTKSMEKTKDFGNFLLYSSQIAFVKITEPLFRNAWNIFCSSPKLSFTDASSIAVIKAIGISHIATFDEALEKQAGAKPVEK